MWTWSSSMMPTVGLERNSKMAVNCSVQWSWKRKAKPNFGCHSNTSISMCDILISVSSWYSNKWLSYIRLNVKVTRVSYVFSCDLRSRDILFRKIFFYYGQPGTMITIFAWQDISRRNCQENHILWNMIIRGQYSKACCGVTDDVIVVKMISFYTICI